MGAAGHHPERRDGVITKEEMEIYFNRLDNSFQHYTRGKDAALAVLEIKNETAGKLHTKTTELLEQHINECAKLQKWVFGILVFLAGWTVARDSDTLPGLFKLIKTIGEVL